MDHRVVWPDGQVRWLRVRKQVFFEGEGSSRRPVRAMLAAMDITDVAKAKLQAEAANRAKDRFLAMLSHELRTPLAPVLVTSELLENHASLSAEHREMAQTIRRNVELEIRLIDDLLDTTRISSNKLKLELSLIDAHEKIRQVIAMCREDAAGKEQETAFQADAKLHHVLADSARFQQIIWNLLKNAIKFTPAKGTIHIATSNTASGQLEIAIIDSGMGISADKLPTIFNAFEQGGEEMTQQYGGLGLGLAISKALTQMHGGTLGVASDGDRKGSTFTLSMPLAAPSVEGRQAAKRADGKALDCSILLVEDHPDTRTVMVRLLKKLGCRVESAGSFAEAMEKANGSQFDLIVSDIGLPDGSGIDLMRQLKQRFNLKGIALSGYGMDDDLHRSREAGFDAHLVKPVNLRLLEETIRRLCESSCG
jgi:signal transduction histidine kinase